jgi:pimeloyl-ACP methyl ester carboxylesterase
MRAYFPALLVGFIGLSLLLVSPARAELVFSEVRRGITAGANYTPGEPDAATVLILHGFLQTHHFYTVRRLHESLAESGYTVLSPTLSLDIDKRKQSLDCEAIHTHDLETDVEEIAHWVNWLNDKIGMPVVLLGHSAGGMVMTRYLDSYPESPVSHSILVSLSYLLGEDKGHQTGPLGEYKLGYCETYPSPPAAYRSYVEWDAEKMLLALRNAGARVSVILGSADERIREDWRDLLSKSEVQITNVEGANHFFDSEHEFDLLDAVEELLAEHTSEN